MLRGLLHAYGSLGKAALCKVSAGDGTVELSAIALQPINTCRRDRIKVPGLGGVCAFGAAPQTSEGRVPELFWGDGGIGNLKLKLPT